MPSPPPKIPPHAPPGFIPPKPLSERRPPSKIPLDRVARLTFADIIHRTAVLSCIGISIFGGGLAVHGVLTRYRKTKAGELDALQKAVS
ncbi:hypothetical protein BD324DRAFT_636384 [Kockovaella imperatae]|uniref:Uncharacterized protein n=1 Tax=Kockovaella imperatae TaxID=4999 RepID=A0A1Y1UAN2_9TREE|nr:hypothetical protein BD324DRAFT_636384 [Kockovaella imperatae]ORX34556.1 hypothetical protein BD324DRAFT_636384 [Kockovaella imperatae]